MTDTTTSETADFLQNNPPPTPASSPGFSILKQVQSDPMLQSTPIPAQIQAIRETLGHPLLDPEHPLSPHEALRELQDEVAAIPRIKLERCIAPGEENSYRVDLARSYEQVQNQVQRLLVSATAFLGHQKTAQVWLSKITPISIWWPILADPNLINDKSRLMFAADKYNQAVDAAKVEVAAVVNVTAQLIKNLKARLKLATDMYQLGRDQINISLADIRIPIVGTPGRASTTLQAAPTRPYAAETLHHAFGDREQESNRTKLKQDDRELEPASEQLFEREAAEPAPAETLGQSEAGGNGNSIAINPAPQPTAEPVNSNRGLEPQVPAQPATVAAETVEPPLTAHKKGYPLLVNFPISLTAPGLTGKHNDVILRRGKTKLELTAQADPAENGVYRWMGPDQPLMPMAPPAKLVSAKAATINPDAPEPLKAALVETKPVSQIDPDDPFAQISVTAGAVKPDATKPAPVNLDDDDFPASITNIVNVTPASNEMPVPIVPDIYMANEDIPGEADDQIDDPPSEMATAPNQPTVPGSLDGAPSNPAGDANDGKTADEDPAASANAGGAEELSPGDDALPTSDPAED